jgi:pimeloyl-ACP methyl ester carboxylesterase
MTRRSLRGLVILLFAASAAVASPQARSFLSNGVNIDYITEGEGEPVVLIHGGGSTAAMSWVQPGIFGNLSKHYHVIALDNRGHGRSDKPHDIEKHGPEMVEDVIRLLDHLQIERVQIVGYSMGEFITEKLVVTHPERVVCAVVGGAGWSRAEDDHTAIESFAKSLESGNGIAPLMKALTPPGRPAPTSEQLTARDQQFMANNDPKALAACIRGMRNLTLTRQQLENNKVPRARDHRRERSAESRRRLHGGRARRFESRDRRERRSSEHVPEP